jgi:hypothetical protein
MKSQIELFLGNMTGSYPENRDARAAEILEHM